MTVLSKSVTLSNSLSKDVLNMTILIGDLAAFKIVLIFFESFSSSLSDRVLTENKITSEGLTFS
jgi:hypothetical protein